MRPRPHLKGARSTEGGALLHLLDERSVHLAEGQPRPSASDILRIPVGPNELHRLLWRGDASFRLLMRHRTVSLAWPQMAGPHEPT